MTRRRRQTWAAWIIVLAVNWGAVNSVWAESIIAQIKSTVDHVVQILKDPRLQRDAKANRVGL